MTAYPLTTHALKDLLAFPFRGKDWQSRFLIGVALTFVIFIPVVPLLFLLGYYARVMRQAVRGETLELPAWEDWGTMAKDGLRLFGVSLVYLLPALVVMMGGILAYFAGFFLTIPAMAVTDYASDTSMMASLLMLAMVGIMFLSMFLGNLLFLLGGIPLPVAQARAVDEEKFSAAFHLRQVFRLLWRNKAGYLIAWVVLLGLFAISYFAFIMFYMTIIFMFLAFLLWIPLCFYLMVISAALFGQTYRESQALVLGE